MVLRRVVLRAVPALSVAGSLILHAGPAQAEDVRVFVLSGQSNMVGYGDGDALPTELKSQPDVLYDFFDPASRLGGDYAGTASTDWEPVAPKGVGGWYGPEITFGRTMVDALPGKRVAIVKVAAPGTNIKEHWGRGLRADPDYPEKSQHYHALMGSLDSAVYSDANGNALLYPDEPTRLDAALARLDAAGDTHELGCFVWVQGENEANWAAAFTYEDTLTALIAALREDLGRPDLPVVLGRTAAQLGQAQGGPAPDANLAAVRAAQEAVAAADPQVEWVDMDDLPGLGDGFHFSSAGYQTLGQRLGGACAQLMSGSSGAGGAGAGGASGSGGAAAGGAPAGEGGDGNGGGDAASGADDGCSCRVGDAPPTGARAWLAVAAMFVASRRLKVQSGVAARRTVARRPRATRLTGR